MAQLELAATGGAGGFVVRCDFLRDCLLAFVREKQILRCAAAAESRYDYVKDGGVEERAARRYHRSWSQMEYAMIAPEHIIRTKAA
jgi:hypothetical protein